ncbi:MAG: EcsC family protein [Bacteroidales bacterium]|nr:EcsC family protein [Bacteroidales bacterium]
MNEESNSEQKVTFLDKVYDIAINGIPKVDKPIAKLVYEYQSKHSSTEKAINEFVLYQKLKCTATGFVTGLGGLLTLPVTIPADLASSLYIETRMIATIAALRGYDIHDDRVKTLVYLCIIGNSAGDIVKQVGIRGTEQLVVKKLLPKISGEIIKKINKAVGFRLLTKGGSKGLINLGKTVPVLGGFIGGSYNLIEVDIYAKRAKKMFNENAD